MVCAGPPALFGRPDGNSSSAADAALAAIIKTFLGLTDVPHSYTGQSLKGVRVNAGETALEFAALVQTFVGLTDGPGAFTGNTLKGIRVNAAETALEYYTRLTAFTQLSDVPATYTGQANKVLVVGPTEVGVEFSSLSSSTSPLATSIGKIRALVLPTAGSIGGLGPTAAQNGPGGVTNPTLVSTTPIGSVFNTQFKSSAAAHNIASCKVPNLLVMRGSAAGSGGFRFLARWATTTAVAQQRCFVGLVSQTTDIADANPSTLVNAIGVGYDSAETQLSMLYNDGSGSCTKDQINTGTGFPVDTTTIYELVMSAAPNASTVEYTIRNLITGTSESGSKTTNLPVNTVGLAPHMWIDNGTTASAVQINLIYMQVEVYA